MPASNRRVFISRFVLGTAALATVGRVIAGATAADGPRDSCAHCEFFTPSADGSTGTCAFAGKSVSADGGCGEFTAKGTASVAAQPR